MEKQIILFDADGVVINSEMFGTHFQELYNVSPEAMRPFYAGVFQECLLGKVDLKEAIVPWLEKWKWNGDAESFLQEWFQFEHRIDQRIMDLIREMREKSVLSYLATNQEKYWTQYLRKEMGFEKVFDGIFSSAEIGKKKPQQEFFEHILQKVGGNKERFLLVDDSLSCVEGARLVGMEAFHYRNFEEFSEYLQVSKQNRNVLSLAK